MALTSVASVVHPPIRTSWLLVWLLAAGAFAWVWQAGPAWMLEYPKAATIPAMRWVGDAMKWLVNDASFGLFSFRDLARFIAAVIEVPYWIASSLLATGFMTTSGSAGVQLVPPVSWIALIGALGLLGLWSGGWRLGLLVTLLMAFIAVFGQWHAAMVTLASIVIAVPLGAVLGLLLGILAYRVRWFERAITPLLDLMQTVPVFAYLVPVLVLFGFGPTSAIVATVIYALPPMTRLTMHALRGVPDEVDQLGRMVGATTRQRIWKVLVPSALPGLMVGLNQVIMLSLNVVIIASMIGAGGLGFEVLGALRRLDFGVGLEAGFAIVALAIVLDRLSQAVASKLQSPQAGFLSRAAGEGDRATAVGPAGRKHGWDRAESIRGGGGGAARRLLQRHPYTLAALALVLVTGLLGLIQAGFQTFPAELRLSTGDFWAGVIEWINVNFFTQLEAFKNLLLLNVLVPLKRLLASLPWAGVVGLIALAGLWLGGWRLALLTGALAFLIAATGQWEKAMTTVYLCGIAVAVAMLIGVPIGILAAERPRLWPAVQAVIDTLQTLPSFVYLMPVVMLFQVGDFTAILAVVLFAIAPAIRYTVHGLQQVDPRLVEAGRAQGATRGQLLRKIKLRLAFPEIMLGLNQTIMLALSMLVITALVGTRDLGQEVYIALAKANTGQGIVAGLAIAFIAIIADRLIAAGAQKQKKKLGLI